MQAKHAKHTGALLILAGLLTSGCATKVRPIHPEPTNRVSTTAEPPDRVLNQPSVKEFTEACDALARELSASELVQRAERPVLIEIKPMADRPGQELDLFIYAHVIREKLMNLGHGKIAFRDEEVRGYIIDDRVDQSGEPVLVIRKESTRIQRRRRVIPRDSYVGRGGTGVPFNVVQEIHETTEDKQQEAEVSSRLADVDYFLTGFVYQQDERTAYEHRRGYRYYRFQFRLTNARDGVMAWERAYEVKNEGVLYD